MLFRLLLLPTIVSGLGVAGFSQPDKELKKKLESDLYKKTPYVKSAKLEGCKLRLSIDVRYDSGFHPFVGTLPNAMPTEGVLNPPHGGTSSRNLIVFEIFLDKINPNEIRVETSPRKEHKVLQVTGDKGSIWRSWNGKRDSTNNLDLTVNLKDAQIVAETVRQAVLSCTR